MSRTAEEYWQLIDELLRKKERNREQGKQLYENVIGLLATAEGRASIRKRLSRDGGSFMGRQRFMDEVTRAMEHQEKALVDLPPRERVEIQETVVANTRPGVDPAHWNMLWLLARDGHIFAGRMVLDSLGKIVKKNDDLLRILPSLPPWQKLDRSRIATLVEAAKKATPEGDLANRLDSVLSWSTAASGTRREAPTPKVIPPAPAASELAQKTPEVHRTNSQNSGAQAEAKPLATPSSMQIQDEVPQALPGLLATIEKLFRRGEEDREVLRGEQARAQEELSLLRLELEVQSASSQDHLLKAQNLELDLNGRTRELAALREEMRSLERQLAQSKVEVEAARRRAEDYIHEANLARDNAVASFQSSLWERLRAYLIEVLDGAKEQDGLSPDQVFFRHRLQEIRETLRQLGVPPY